MEQEKESILRRLWWIPTVALSVLAVALVIANLMGTRMADWTAAAVAAAIAAAVFFVWKVGQGRLALRITVTCVGIAGALICIGGAYFSPYWNSIVMGMNPVTRRSDAEISQVEAYSDLQYAIHYLTKVHPELMEGVSGEFRQSCEVAGEKIADADAVTVTEFAGILQGAAASLGDAHTGISLTYAHDAGEPHRLPTEGEHSSAGDVLTHINGIPVEQLFDERRDLVVAETDEYGARRLARYAMSLEGLQYLGIPVGPAVTYTFARPDGTTIEETVSAQDFIDAASYDALYPDDANVTEGFASYDIDPERSLAILRLDTWVNNAEFQSIARQFFTEVHDEGIRNVAVDLRRNAGGDIEAVYEFLKYIDTPSYMVPGQTRRFGPVERIRPAEVRSNPLDSDLAFTGNLYALTSAETMSSAMVFAEILQDNDMGTVIGEVPGDSANGYGDLVMFELPNSHLLLSVSSMERHRIDSGSSDYVEPDVPAEAAHAVEALYDAI